VADQNGAAVPAADITLTNDQTKDQRNSSTNEAGRFSFASVQPVFIRSRLNTRDLKSFCARKYF
jgi:hypothetical protein